MAVKTYSLRAGNVQLSLHFKLSEFQCRDGSDTVLVDSRLIDALERIRTACGNRAVSIYSGYRTEAYNKKCGGAPKSQHLYGTAVDIAVAGVDALRVAEIAETVLASMGIQGGIGYYPNRTTPFTHVDVRPIRARWRQDGVGKPQYNVPGFGGFNAKTTLRKGNRGEEVRRLQQALIDQGYKPGTMDGAFGADTEAAVKAYQADHSLQPDGVVGAKTWAKLGV